MQNPFNGQAKHMQVVGNLKEGDTFHVGGVIADIQERTSRRNSSLLVATIHTPIESYSFNLWPNKLRNIALHIGTLIELRGRKSNGYCNVESIKTYSWQ